MLFLSSIVAYTMAIFVAIIIDKSRMAQERQPRFMTYVMAVVFSTLVSLSFFHFLNRNIQLAWEAYVSLALSMGVVAIAVVHALSKATCNSRKEVFRSAVRHALPLGLVAAFFQTAAAISFRGGFGEVTSMGLVITAGYGFIKGALVVYAASYLIQERIRIQLIIAQRQPPRARFETRISAVLGDEPFSLTTRDISSGGLRIEPGRPLEKGQAIDLNFAFGLIQAKVQWVSERFAGLAFTADTPNINELKQFIRGQFGLAYA